MKRILASLAVLACTVFCQSISLADEPQFRGQDREDQINPTELKQVLDRESVSLPKMIEAAEKKAGGKAVAAKIKEWGDVKSVVSWRHPLIESLNLAEALGRLQVPLHITSPIPPAAGKEFDQAERERQRSATIASYIGVTSADFCLADTATLVMRSRPGQPRSVALVPSIHIAVITVDQIVADMKELFALLRWDERFRPEGLSNYMSFISGPSKTADIEATMVHGAHGPREVHLLVITG